MTLKLLLYVFVPAGTASCFETCFWTLFRATITFC